MSCPSLWPLLTLIHTTATGQRACLQHPRAAHSNLFPPPLPLLPDLVLVQVALAMWITGLCWDMQPAPSRLAVEDPVFLEKPRVESRDS